MPAIFANIVIAFIALVAAIIYSGRTSFVTQKLNEIVHRKPGCNPIPAVGNVTLHYFAGRGRGEAIRMLMAYGDIPWSETKFTKETWPAAKKTGVDVGFYTFGQAIVHFLARSTGHDCDCSDLHFCHQIALGVEDITSKLSKIVYNPDFSRGMREEYMNVILPTWLGYFENIAPQRDLKGRELHFASERVTWVDFLVFNLLETNYNFEETTRQANEPAIDILEKFQKLQHFYQEFQLRPGLRHYLNDPDRHAYKIPYPLK
eukprot:gene7682-8519_t